MIRTRDFLLFCLATSFLVIAILVTLGQGGDARSGYTNIFTDEPAVAYEAVVPAAELDRAARLASLRAKIAALGDERIAAAVPSATAPSAPGPDAPALADVATSAAVDAISRCDDYIVHTPYWPVGDIEVEDREGVRVFYTLSTELRPSEQGSTTAMVPVEVETVHLSLPIRTTPLAGERCIPTDVVGIALDGSLIRNSDDALYGVFGPETRVGFALDGFPIYGRAPGLTTDTCGGTVVDGEYRYYLSAERPSVLGCYRGIPTTLE